MGDSDDANGVATLLLNFWTNGFCPCVAASLAAASVDRAEAERGLHHLMQQMESCLFERQSQFEDESHRQSFHALAATLGDANRARRAQLQRGAEELETMRRRHDALCTEHNLELQRAQRED